MMPEQGRTPIESAIDSLSNDTLLHFLERQRWFGVKGAAGAIVRVADALVVPWGYGAFAVARLVVTTATESHTYQVPLGASEAIPAKAPESAVLSRGEAGGKRVIVYDAMYDPEFVRGLTRAVQSGAVIGEGGHRLIVERVPGATFDLGADPAATISAAEQSNTSLIIGDMALLKVLRTLNAGVHPEAEAARFLTTHAHFTHTPALLATLQFDDDGVRTTAGLVQEYLHGAIDAWSYALDRGRAYFAAPASKEGPNAFLKDAKQLGAVTRLLHDALSASDEDPDFAPEPVLPGDLDRWAQRTKHTVHESLALLERQLASPVFPRERVTEAQVLVKRRDHYDGWIDEIVDLLGDDLGMRTRVHGDYHLGQVLRTKSGDFTIIDFEGEPARSLAERREKTSPLRDVAGMLRSFAYASATLAMSEGRNAPPHVRELRAARWERDVRAAYLDGYFEAPDDESILPSDEKHAKLLVALFETEKAFYELAYELNNRPGWVGIPMRGISKLLTR